MALTACPRKNDFSKNSKISFSFRVYLRWALRPRFHEQIKPSLIAQIIDPCEVTPDEFAQINVLLFAHVHAA